MTNPVPASSTSTMTSTMTNSVYTLKTLHPFVFNETNFTSKHVHKYLNEKLGKDVYTGLKIAFKYLKAKTGYHFVIAGGCIVDAVLNRPSMKDLDVFMVKDPNSNVPRKQIMKIRELWEKEMLSMTMKLKIPEIKVTRTNFITNYMFMHNQKAIDIQLIHREYTHELRDSFYGIQVINDFDLDCCKMTYNIISKYLYVKPCCLKQFKDGYITIDPKKITSRWIMRNNKYNRKGFDILIDVSKTKQDITKSGTLKYKFFFFDVVVRKRIESMKGEGEIVSTLSDKKPYRQMIYNRLFKDKSTRTEGDYSTTTGVLTRFVDVSDFWCYKPAL